MTTETIITRTFENGLTVVLQPMPAVRSAAFSLLLPAGSVYDGTGRNGEAAILSDLITRGAGGRNSRELSAALDNLGVQRHESVGTAHLTFTGATVAENLLPALEIYADVVLRPHLPAEQFEPARAGVAQTLHAIEDDPRQRIIPELRRRCYPAPWGRPTDGTLPDLPNIDHDAVRGHYERGFRPNEAIFGIAGCIDVDRVTETLGELFGEWAPQPSSPLETGSAGPPRDHISYESSQTHIGIAYDAVPYRDPDYYAAWAAVSVLSGGMSSRLFTEVRERRGLCYAVSASLSSLKDEARVLCYVGTTAERAQETFDVTLAELAKLGEGIAQDELDRCRARAKSALVMQQESTISRSSSIARDWYHLGRVRTLDEVHDRVDALTVETVLDYVHAHPARDFTVLTIGPAPLEG